VVGFFSYQRRWLRSTRFIPSSLSRGAGTSSNRRWEMKLRPGGLLTRSTVGTLLALLTSWAVTPAAVQAGCSGHYLSGRSLISSATRLDSLSTVDFRNLASRETPAKRPAPCTSALCSGNPAAPLSTAPSLPPGSTSDWALPLALVARPGSARYQGRPSGDDLRPVNRPSSIFHPPRPLA
jgi:hypothetical protein